MSEREQFEAWMSDNGKYNYAIEKKNGQYILATTITQWEAWQASREALKDEQGQTVQPIAWLNDAYLARGVVDGEAGDEDAGPGYIPVYREPLPIKGDGWIACADRMPETGIKVLCFPERDEPIHAIFNGQLWLQDVSWGTSAEPIDNVILPDVTHWMPLPSPPAINHPIDTTPNQYDALGKGGEQ